MSYRLRPATIEDLPILLTFEQGIIKAEREFENSLKDGEIHYYDLESKIDNENAQILVVDFDDELAASGFVEILDAEEFEKYSKFSSFRFMYVKEAHRNKGLNKMILNGLIEWSDSKNIKEIKLNVFDENIPALNAYLKAGFKKTMVEMHLFR